MRIGPLLVCPFCPKATGARASEAVLRHHKRTAGGLKVRAKGICRPEGPGRRVGVLCMARESHVEGTGTPPALLRSSCTRSPGSWKSRLPTARRFSSRASSCASILHLRRFAATDRARRSCKSARKMSRSRTSTRSAPTRSSSAFPTATIPADIRGHFSTTTELHQEQMWQRCSAKSVRLCPSTPPLPRFARTFSQANDHGGEVGQLPSPAGKRAGLGFHGFREEPVSIFAGLFGTVHGTV